MEHKEHGRLNWSEPVQRIVGFAIGTVITLVAGIALIYFFNLLSEETTWETPLPQHRDE